MKRLLAFLLLLSASVSLAHDELAEQVNSVTLKIQHAPHRADLYFQRGELYRADSHWKKAEKDYLQARKLAPEMAAPHLGLGLVFLRTARFAEAKQSLEHFLQHQPDHAEARVALAQALDRTGSALQAIEEYSRALALRPDPEIYIERSRLLADVAHKPEEALEGLDEGIRRLGPIVTLELSAIDLELQLKQYDRALERVERIAQQSERKETWLTRRGEILVRADRKAEARATFLEALSEIEKLPESRKNNRYTKELVRRIEEALGALERIQIQ